MFATRQSLLLRLKDQEDQDGWREFFDTYWRLIYSFCLKSHLTESEAEEVVQDTMISVAREIPTFRYDRSKGSFRAWLLTIVRRRLIDRTRQRARWSRLVTQSADREPGTDAPSAEPADTRRSELDLLWASEWEGHLIRRALDHVRSKVPEKQYLIYEMLVLREVPLKAVVSNLQTTTVAVYRAKHRVGQLLRTELDRLREEDSL